ncbi:hypothetical protein BC629DRAFT_1187918 [Irpex lacteus]|nr:hypothetical protein BC629DRAFT_1187918 [Irpex lacteus]
MASLYSTFLTNQSDSFVAAHTQHVQRYSNSSLCMLSHAEKSLLYTNRYHLVANRSFDHAWLSSFRLPYTEEFAALTLGCTSPFLATSNARTSVQHPDAEPYHYGEKSTPFVCYRMGCLIRRQKLATLAFADYEATRKRSESTVSSSRWSLTNRNGLLTFVDSPSSARPTVAEAG